MRKTLTESNKGRCVPLEPCLETGDYEEKCRPENPPPREIWLKGAVVEELFPIESLFLVSVVYTTR